MCPYIHSFASGTMLILVDVQQSGIGRERGDYVLYHYTEVRFNCLMPACSATRTALQRLQAGLCLLFVLTLAYPPCRSRPAMSSCGSRLGCEHAPVGWTQAECLFDVCQLLTGVLRFTKNIERPTMVLFMTLRAMCWAELT